MLQPQISIICATYNGEPKLPGLLLALQTNFANAISSFELIFVIDGSTDESEKLLREFVQRNPGKDIQIIKNSSNQGISISRNRGITASTSQFIAFVDDDCRPESLWVDTLCRYWEKAPNFIVGVGGFVKPSEIFSFNQKYCALIQPLRPFPLVLQHSTLRDRLKRYYGNHGCVFNFAEYLVGANMSFRKSALEQVGLFSAEMSFGGDDSYICMKLRGKFGDTCLAVIETLTMPHEYSIEFKDSLRRSLNYGVGAGRNFLLGKSGISINPGPILIISVTGILSVVTDLSTAVSTPLPPITLLLLSLTSLFYAIFVTRNYSKFEVQYRERVTIGLAFLLCELANLVGFLSAIRYLKIFSKRLV